MTQSLNGQKVAALVANGFSEKDLIAMQKAMIKAGADLRIVSMDNGLVNSWNEEDGQWGLNFAADAQLSQALAADYDILVLPGGERSLQKLELTAHTRRIVGGFIDSSKPVVFMGEAVRLVLFSERAEGLSLAGPENMEDVIDAKGAQYSGQDVEIDGDVMSGVCDAVNRDDFIAKAVSFLQGKEAVSQGDLEAVAA